MSTILPTLLRLATTVLVAALAPGAFAAPAGATAPAAARAALAAAPAPGTSGSGLIANRGQWDAQVLFMTPIKGGRAWVTASGIVYDFSQAAKREQGRTDASAAQPPAPAQPPAHTPDAKPRPERLQGHVVRLAFAGALQPAVRPKGKLTTRLNYLQGSAPLRHARSVPAYAAVSLDGVWPGVDLGVAQGPDGLSLTFKAADAAALARVRLVVDGAALLEGRGDGAVVATSVGQRSLGAVAVTLGSARHAGRLSGGGVALAAGRQVAQAAVARQEEGGVLVYSTFLGGSDGDLATALAVDASGAAHVIGHTYSMGFPTTPGAYDRTHHSGSYDVFVTKLAADGSALVYSTFLGGSSWDYGHGLAVDASGAAYAMGHTASTDFPTTPGVVGRAHSGGSYDTFVTKLAADGSALVYSTFLGGSGADYSSGLAVDASGAAYVTGQTDSTDFPTTPAAFDRVANGTFDAFVTKLAADGSALAYSSFLGGSGSDRGLALAVDASGAAYVTGSTWSSNFPTTPGAFDTSYNVIGDVFATKLSADGATLAYATFIGGSGVDDGRALAVDASGSAYLTGVTYSSDFPVTPGAHDRTLHGTSDTYVAKLAADGSALDYATFLGGRGDEEGLALAVDASGSAHVAGIARSADFPTTPGAFDTIYSRSGDAFVTRLAADGGALLYSTFLGSSRDDVAHALALDASGAVYVTGETSSAAFPTTPGAYDTRYNRGLGDAFVAKLDLGAPAGSVELSASATPTTVAAGGSFTVSYTVANDTADPVAGDLGFTAVRKGRRVAQGLLVSGAVPALSRRSGSFTQSVPATAAPGVYTYTLRIGQFPNSTVDKVAVKITVTGAARAGGGVTAWEVANAVP